MNDEHPRMPVERELAAISERLSMIDQADLQLTDLVQQVFDAVQQTTEARAQASLEIATSLQRIREACRRMEFDRDAVLHGLVSDIDQVIGRASELNGVLDALGRHIGALDAQIVRVSIDEQVETTPATPSPTDSVATCAEAGYSLVVTGVPSAATALSIQRYCTGLPGVQATTTRSYQQGELRIDVRSEGDCLITEFDDWPDGVLLLESASPGLLQFRMVPPDAAPVKA